MQLIDGDNVAVDVDDTLVMWDNPTVNGPGKVPVQFAGETVYLTPHTYHIQLIKMYKERGYNIFVWSANGKFHVERVINALGIKDYVDFGMTKFCKHMDDSEDPGSILGPRVYTKDFTKPVEEPKVFIPYGFDVVDCAGPVTIGGIANGR